MRAVSAHKLGIPYYLVDEAEEFQKQVINYFADGIQSGAHAQSVRDVQSRSLKFGTLINRAQTTRGGIYRHRPFRARGNEPENGRFLLKRGRDSRKDQSYFLFSLQQEQLARSHVSLWAK